MTSSSSPPDPPEVSEELAAEEGERATEAIRGPKPKPRMMKGPVDRGKKPPPKRDRKQKPTKKPPKPRGNAKRGRGNPDLPHPRRTEAPEAPSAPEAAPAAPHRLRASKGGGTWPPLFSAVCEVPEDKREQAVLDLERMLAEPPDGWDMPITPDTMIPDGGGGLVRLGERVASMAMTGIGANVCAGAVGVPRPLFARWIQIGTLARQLFGFTAAMSSTAAPYVKFAADILKAVDGGEAKLIFHWSVAAAGALVQGQKAGQEGGIYRTPPDWRAAASLVRYVNPERFAPETRGGGPMQLPAPDTSGEDKGPIRFFLPTEEPLRPEPEERETIDTTGISREASPEEWEAALAEQRGPSA